MTDWGWPASEKAHSRKQSVSFRSELSDSHEVEAGKDDSFGDQGFGSHDTATAGDKSNACFNCGKEGHLKFECPDLPEGKHGAGGCYGCGEEGHIKAECPNRKPMTCHHCNKEGHIAKECPERPTDLCKNCKEEGHVASGCTNNRKIDFGAVADMDPDAAWKLIQDASDAKDLDDFREALKIYHKAVPDLTYKQLESGFRSMNLNFYAIALDKPIDEVYTIMDMQGKLGMKYCVGFFLSPKCPRKAMLSSWPPSPEENLERLENAGIPVDRFVIRCVNCKKIGHIAKSCPEEKSNPERGQAVHCFNCDEDGHRMRDCPKPRVDKYACRNCNKRGHDSKECPEPPNPANVVCKNCDKKGHFARDCPDRPPEKCNNCGEEGHRAKDCTVQKCRNCDAEGHIAKDCPKPRDYSRVKCNNCGQMGHTKVRCKEPIKEDDGGFGSGDFGGSGKAGEDWGSFGNLKISKDADNAKGGLDASDWSPR